MKHVFICSSHPVGFNIFHHQLGGGIAVVVVFFNRVADAERIHVFDVFAMFVHTESNGMNRSMGITVY